MVKDMGPQEFSQRRDEGRPMTLLDVREDWEIQLAPVPSVVVHIPMGEISERFSELDPRKDTVVICRSGGRSLEVARFLDHNGFGSVYNHAGGILAWSRE